MREIGPLPPRKPAGEKHWDSAARDGMSYDRLLDAIIALGLARE